MSNEEIAMSKVGMDRGGAPENGQKHYSSQPVPAGTAGTAARKQLSVQEQPKDGEDESDDDDDDDDPIVASYDIFIKPRISSDRQIYVLQFPNRDASQPYSEKNGAQPTGMRVKPSSGMVELDVPIDAYRNFDRTKGVSWGDALLKSNQSKGRGSHGLPGGFGIGGAQPTGRGRGRAGEDDSAILAQILNNYGPNVDNGTVLTRQTLGGQALPRNDTHPHYMVGTFRKDQLHLTPVDHIVQMRPQFHHIDALAEHQKASQPRDTPARVQEARAIHMTVKSTIDGEEDSNDTMAERISAVQAEIWKHYRYIDEDTDEAWHAFGESLYVGGNEEGEDYSELKERVPKLVSVWTDTEYLDAISAPRNEAKFSKNKKVIKEPKGKGRDEVEKATVGADENPDLEKP